MDDPLRLLRCVRFAARFGFTLHPSIVETATKEDVTKALSEKVSKERIGTEIQKTFKGTKASQIMKELKNVFLKDIFQRIQVQIHCMLSHS